ncbi:MAG: Ger(x)C family spore germination protein [Syntrophomonas sp.]|nr:Ger(x)C family spore germination protein [Syntrophomonas sp.]
MKYLVFKKINFISALLIFSIFFCGGCWDRHELDSLAIVSGIALDKNNDGQISSTAQLIDPGQLKSSQEGNKGEGQAFWNVRGTGNTTFDMLRNCTHKSPGKLLVSHCQVVIFGEDLAKEGIKENLDILVRDFEFRDTLWLLVAEGKGSEVLETKTRLEKIPAFNISKMVRTQDFNSHAIGVNLHDFINLAISPATSAVVPIIRVDETNNEKFLNISGMAVFDRNLKLISKLNKEESRGLLWVIGKIKTGIIVVNSPQSNGTASLEILKASSKITPEIKENEVEIIVNIKAQSNLGDIQSIDNLLYPEIWNTLNRHQSAAIEHEVGLALDKARHLNADIFGFGEAIYKKYPREWKQIEPYWQEVFPTIDVKVQVETKLSMPSMAKDTIKLK